MCVRVCVNIVKNSYKTRFFLSAIINFKNINARTRYCSKRANLKNLLLRIYTQIFLIKSFRMWFFEILQSHKGKKKVKSFLILMKSFIHFMKLVFF